MKIIEKGNFLQKITVSLCLIILLFNVICPIKSQADATGSIVGVLVSPITFLFKVVGDGFVGILQYYFVGGPIRGISVMKDTQTDQEVLSTLGIISKDGLDKKSNFDNSIINWGKSTPIFKEGSKDGELGEGVENEKNINNFLEQAFENIKDTLSGIFGDSSIEDGRPYDIPMIVYSPEAIFSNKIRAFDINFINPNKNTGKNAGYEYQETTMGSLQKNIATWYNALRMLAAALMLPILIYVGIRIIISSAGEKAKYKEMLMDWVVAMCLLFVMHYIMAFIINITDSITNIVSSGTNTTLLVKVSNEEGSRITYFQTNAMGLARFRAEYVDIFASGAYLMIYLMMVVFTVIYTWIYLKRSLMIAFLTLIAPLITLTYPIDRLGDGKSQGFDIWLKEYVFNALIQPFHLIVYTVLASGAVSQASEGNPILAIAAMAFLLPAEKLLKKMFDFDKASTGAAGTSGTAAALGGLNLLSNAKQLKQLGSINKAKSASVNSGGGASGTSESVSGKKPSFNYNNLAGALGEGDDSGLEATMPLNNENIDLNNSENNKVSQQNRLGEIDSRLSEINDQGGRESLMDPNSTYTDMYMNGNNFMESEYDRLKNERAEIIAEQRRKALEEQRMLAKGNNDEDANKTWFDKGKDFVKKATGNPIVNRKIKGIGKGAIKGGATLLGAIGGAMGGTALGLATGDLSKGVSMGIAGAGLGGTSYRWVPSKIGKNAKATMDEIRYLKDPVGTAKKDAARKKAREKKAYMADTGNYKSAAKMANELGLSNGDIPKLQEQMYELGKYQVSNYDDQKKAVEMVNNHGSEGLDIMSAASLVHEDKNADYSYEKTRQKKYNSWVEENTPTMGVKNAQRLAQQRMSWQMELHSGGKTINSGRNYIYTGKDQNIKSQLGRNNSKQ